MTVEPPKVVDLVLRGLVGAGLLYMGWFWAFGGFVLLLVLLVEYDRRRVANAVVAEFLRLKQPLLNLRSDVDELQERVERLEARQR